MSEWNKYNLEDLVFVDKEQLSNSTDSEYSFYYIDISSVSTNQIQFPDFPISFSSSPSRARKILHDGDVLMATVRPNLKAFAKFKKPANRNYIASTGFAVLSKKESADLDFIYHSLFSYAVEKQIETLVVGSNYPALNTGDICKLKILAPSLSTQRKISQILSTADAVIEKTQAAITKYKAIKQGMLHDLFTRGIDIQTGKLRPRYEDAPELYNESKLGWIPSEWEVETLENICSMKSGEGITSIRIHEMGDYPVYGGNGLRGFTNTYTNDGEYTLIGRQGALCGNITRVSGKFYASEHAVVVTVENEIDVDWLAQKLDTMNLNQYSEASAQPGLSVNKILRLSISKPSFREQEKIAERLLSIDQKLQTEQIYLHKLQQIKQGLMGDLLSGKKTVKVEEELVTHNFN